ncbi:hypothetical protein CKO36_06350 [Rhabdochromatium marinum]|nr:hypothetical protein [Rhabdochromatium marinum]
MMLTQPILNINSHVPRMARLLVLSLLLLLPVLAGATDSEAHPSWVHHASTDVGKKLAAAVHDVSPLVDRYGYAAAFVAMLVEGFGLPAPGQTLMMASALEAAEGRLNIYLVLGCATLAAVLGNTLGYVIGRFGGTALLRRLPVNAAHEASIARLFERYGGSLILFARFFDGLRQLNGLVAGALQMRLAVFMAFNVAGALCYVSVWGFGIFYLREHLPQIYQITHQINPWVAGFAVVAVILMLIYLFWGRFNGYRRQ